jgi:GNAT superfamily N-acetyltransferase
MIHNSSFIEIPETPVIPGLGFRPYLGDDDLPAIAAVMNASFQADMMNDRITAEGLSIIYKRPVNWNPQRDSLLVMVNGVLMSFANTEWRDEQNDNRAHSINLYLLAAYRGRGLEPVMQRYMERIARQLIVVEPDGLRHWFSSLVAHTWRARVEMLRDSGYIPSINYYEMQRSLLNDDLPEVVLPAGFEVRSPLPEHFRAIWEATEECFRDQQDYYVSNDEDFHTWVSSPDFNPDLWLVAWDGDQVAGATLNSLHEGNWGETDDLFVRRPWRKRGLGRALLVATLQRFKERGLVSAGLGVDSQNLSGALRLYESLGYQPYQRVTSYRKPVDFH